MNKSQPAPICRPNRFTDIPEAEIFYAESEGDYTVRPIPPELLAQAIAERDRIRDCVAAQKLQEEAGDRPVQ